MKKATLVKLICLAIACMLLIPMVIACGEEDPTTPSTDSSATKEMITISFSPRGGDIIDGDEEIEIEKGTKLKSSMLPEAEKDGYEFLYWAYDRAGEEEWDSVDIFNENTTLYAIWEEEDNGGTGTSKPGDDEGDDPVVPVEKVTIEFDTGRGYFADSNDYEKVINKGGRLDKFPTPVTDESGWAFAGWYKDEACTIAASLSNKYDVDTMLYAKWDQKAECTDGSYDHLYGPWEEDQKADCTKPGTSARYCEYCQNKEIKIGDPAKGHSFGLWEEAFMAKQRTCSRPGCGEKEIIQYKDVTEELLGNDPGEQIEGSTEKFYSIPFTSLVNNKWDESWGEFVGPNGTGKAHVIFNLVEATTLDRIYFKGSGVTTINIFVQYEGESDFVRVGGVSSAPDKESTPFVEPDATKKIVAIKFVEDNPPQGTSMWQEVAFVKVAEE